MRHRVFNTSDTSDIMSNNAPGIKSIRDCVYIAILVSILLTCLLINMKMIDESQQLATDHHRNFPTDLKYILFWRRSKSNRRMLSTNIQPDYLPGQSMFINQKCEFINCFITYDKELLRGNIKNFDVIVFNIRDIYTVKRKKFLPSRSPNQLFIFNSMDSASLFPLCFKVYDNFFNLTWTYRLDSDIPHPYFNIYDSKNILVGPKRQMNWIIDMKHTRAYENIILFKTKAVAWIVNKCRSRRKHNKLVKDFEKELKSYNYSLDIYGHCGAKKCPDGDCHKLIESDYYFQLILEDTTSADHVTERMAVAMMHTVIPIVQGGSEYDSYLPPGSYINFNNFTLKELGAVIDYLIKNPQYYEYFMDWKNYYHYAIKPKDYVCDLCAHVNKNREKFQRSHENFRTWWNPNHADECHEKRIYDLFLNYD